MDYELPTEAEIEDALNAMQPAMTPENAERMADVTNRTRLKAVMAQFLEMMVAAQKAGLPVAVALPSAVLGAMGYGIHLGIYVERRRAERAAGPVQ